MRVRMAMWGVVGVWFADEVEFERRFEVVGVKEVRED
jgi:hypothetical protein